MSANDEPAEVVAIMARAEAVRARLTSLQRVTLAMIAAEPRYTTTMTTRRPREYVLLKTADVLVRAGLAEWRATGADVRPMVTATAAGRAALATKGAPDV